MVGGKEMIKLFLSSNFGDWKAPEGSIVFPESGKAPADIFAFTETMIVKSLKEDVAIVTYSELILLRVQRKMLESEFGLEKEFSVKLFRVDNGVVRTATFENVYEGDIFAEDYFETVKIQELISILREIKKG